MKIKAIFYILLVAQIVGCATGRNTDCWGRDAEYKFYYKHAAHGEVLGSNPLYKMDYEACKADVYKRGVMINGNLTHDAEEIKKATVTMLVEQSRRQIAEIDKAYAGAGANAGIAGAVAVSGGNYTAIKPTVKEVSVSPEYADLERASTDIEKCVSNKGWVKTKMEKICKSDANKSINSQP